MMRRIRKQLNPAPGRLSILLLASFLAIPVGCDRENNEDLIEAAVGDPFVIELAANWSTGYHWSWTNKDEVTIADTTGMEYVADDPGLGGTAGREIWTFSALKKGEEALQFRYLSPDPAGGGAEETREFTLIVH
ncbi:MAG TPA: hypothetical protein ENO05_05135 [Bacteroides sp.]|nr:hypothetical protein [Bacteroides sp.]